jgi:hypothetical protein
MSAMVAAGNGLARLLELARRYGYTMEGNSISVTPSGSEDGRRSYRSNDDAASHASSRTSGSRNRRGGGGGGGGGAGGAAAAGGAGFGRTLSAVEVSGPPGIGLTFSHDPDAGERRIACLLIVISRSGFRPPSRPQGIHPASPVPPAATSAWQMLMLAISPRHKAQSGLQNSPRREGVVPSGSAACRGRVRTLSAAAAAAGRQPDTASRRSALRSDALCLTPHASRRTPPPRR